MLAYTVDKDNNSLIRFENPFVFHCNCPGVMNMVSNLLAEAGLTNKVAITSLPSDKIIRNYVMDTPIYNELVATPNVNGRVTYKKYAVMINPTTGEYVDILTPSTRYNSLGNNMANERVTIKRDLIKRIKEVYNSDIK